MHGEHNCNRKTTITDISPGGLKLGVAFFRPTTNSESQTCLIWLAPTGLIRHHCGLPCREFFNGPPGHLDSRNCSGWVRLC